MHDGMGNLQIHISIQLLHGYMYIKKGFLEEEKRLTYHKL